MKPSLSEEGGAKRRVMGRECEDCHRWALSPFLKEFRKSLENGGGCGVFGGGNLVRGAWNRAFWAW